MASKLTPRGRALRWMTDHRGITEQPPGSNTDERRDGIRAAQQRIGSWLVGQAWCGVWVVNAAMAGGVRPEKPYRWASVWFIEVDAKAKANGFRGWTTKANPKVVLRGDLVVVGGAGVHVEMVREIKALRPWRPYRVVVTDGGNTSPGRQGSQSNGGGAFRRERTMREIHGFALVDYPDK